MTTQQHFTLSKADDNLFAVMRASSSTAGERQFFKRLEWKEQHEPAFSNELLVYEKENTDGIFLIRKYYDTYLIGMKHVGSPTREYETTTLASALEADLSTAVGYGRKMSLHDWLRGNDYECVRYDRNYDND